MAKYSAFGSALHMGSSNYLPTYATIAQLDSIDGPDMKADMVDVTNHQSPGRFKEFVKATLEAGEVKANVFWDPALVVHQDVRKALKSVNSRLFQITEVTTGLPIVEFEGFVSSATFKRDYKGALTGAIAIHVTGEPMFWDEVV